MSADKGRIHNELSAAKDFASERIAFVQDAAIQVTTITITRAADLAALANGVTTKTKTASVACPTGAILIGADEAVSVAFTDGSSATYTAEIGIASDADAVRTSQSVATTSGFPRGGTAGVLGYVGASLSGATLQVKLTSSADLNTATAGALSFKVYWAVPHALLS